MKLIHRLSLELTSKQHPDCAVIKITASFYRPFLDGSYQKMIADMMESGCFDNFIQLALEHLLRPGM